MVRINKQEECVRPIYTGIYQQHKGYYNEVDYYTAYLLNTQDYYLFGMLMPGRTFVNSSYRYGFNGQEWDNDIAGVNGANYTATFCEYDSRLGRRWNLDPKSQISISDYACFGDSPIWYNDVLVDAAGDYYKTTTDGKVVFDFSDGLCDDKVYLDNKELPCYEDRLTLKQKVEGHLKDGLTFDEIGGLNREINISQENNPYDPGKVENVFVDAEPAKAEPGKDAEIDLLSGKYIPPAGYAASTGKINYTWHLHPSGAYGYNDNGTFSKISYAEISNYSRWESWAVGPTKGVDKGKWPGVLEFTFEPKNRSVYTIDNNENTSKVPFDCFFNVQEGSIYEY